jgi:hypothetical protein
MLWRVYIFVVGLADDYAFHLSVPPLSLYLLDFGQFLLYL